MKHYSIVLNEQQLKKLSQFYQPYLTDVKKPYVAFTAVHNQVRITAFTTGKLLIQGESLDKELSSIKALLGIKKYAAIGSDEVGTGDVFGPIVVCSCYTSVEDLDFLESLNVRDSKNMTNRTILEIGSQIANKLSHSIAILSPEKYNALSKQGMNLNKMKALLHNHMIMKTTSKISEAVPVILDQFCLPTHYFNYLKDEKLVYRNIEFHTKAESVHLSVAAASIIARYAFLVKMRELSKSTGYKLKLGASREVDEQLKEIYDNLGAEILPKIAKCNFKNVTKQNFSL